MSLREMHEQQKQSSPREQLQELDVYKRQVQYQGIFQGFRMVGTQSKLGKRYPVKAFETGERVTIEYLNGYLMDKSKAVTDFHYKSDLSLAEALKKYPEWYEKRIVQGEHRERWHIKRDLYDWWLRKIKEGASVGHRDVYKRQTGHMV